MKQIAKTHRILLLAYLLITNPCQGSPDPDLSSVSLRSLMSLKLTLVTINEADIRSACKKVFELFQKTYPMAPAIEYRIAYLAEPTNEPVIKFSVENVTLWDALRYCADLTGRGMSIHEKYLDFYLPKLLQSKRVSYIVTPEFASFLTNQNQEEVETSLLQKAVEKQTGLTVLSCEESEYGRTLELIGSNENHEELEMLLMKHLDHEKETMTGK